MKKILLLILIITFVVWLSGCSESNRDKTVSGISEITLSINKIPLFKNSIDNEVIEVQFLVSETDKSVELRSVDLFFSENSQVDVLSAAGAGLIHFSETDTLNIELGNAEKVSSKMRIPAKRELIPGENTIRINLRVSNLANLGKSVVIEQLRLNFSGRQSLSLSPDEKFAFRPAIKLRAAGQDSSDTYRIPGIITTNEGTLIAVYDVRYNNSKDLQEDIDVGMSRSTDGGETWEPMQIIMDMGEWGGRPGRLNGIGDPSVLYDHITGTIWVAALWMSGSSPDQMLWWASQPGMSPEETGQFILVNSTDDGLSWSEPINITSQIKDPAWQLLLQGPGAGITMKDGTLVFPAQFKADIGEKALDGGQYTCHSTIVYSTDSGETWQIGNGAKSNTTEAQVVQLVDGSLMLNMRDDLNRSEKGEKNGRAVSVTTDLGQTWTTHPSSNSALPEPNCMASIIAADVLLNGQKQQVLFFSNPNNKTSRTNMTIKASFDDGNTWPEANQAELFAPSGFGYSCLTMVDENTIGIVYEGVKELYFQKVAIYDLVHD